MSKVWDVPARTKAVIELGDHLARQGLALASPGRLQWQLTPMPIRLKFVAKGLAISTWVRVYRRCMTEKLPLTQGSWVDAAPQACTLPTVDRPLRAAEWEELFATGVTAVHRIGQERARMEVRADPAVAGLAADLAVRETGCCSFFAFTQTASGGRLTLDITVPPTQVPVLDAMVDRARAAVEPGLR